MTAFCVGPRGRSLRDRLSVGFLLAVLLAVATAAPTRAAEPILVMLDQAKIIKMPERTGTIVVGNPLIADISVQTGNYIVLTGKGYGSTNLIALDRTGNVLLEQSLLVQGPRHTVVVYRGVNRETYSCTPICEQRGTLGDAAAFFETGLVQTNARNSIIQGAASK